VRRIWISLLSNLIQDCIWAVILEWVISSMILDKQFILINRQFISSIGDIRRNRGKASSVEYNSAHLPVGHKNLKSTQLYYDHSQSRLARMIFQLLNDDIYFYLSSYLTPFEIIQLSSLNHTFQAIFQSIHIWEQLLQLYHPNSSPSFLIRYCQTNPYEFYKYSAKCSSQGNLLHSNIYTSSVDREEEGGNNLLSESFCHTCIERYSHQLSNNQNLGIQFQMQCGCYFGHPCYWSSKGTSSQDDNEELVFTPQHSLLLISSFQITPYQSFFHPNFPIYAPFSVQLQFVSSTNQNLSYYDSPVFNMEPTSLQQSFQLPHPVLFCSGNIKIRLFGKRESQPIGPSDYYVCLSYVGVSGKILSEYESIEYPNSSPVSSSSPVGCHQIRRT
jgi:hypothetical protein